MLTVFQWGILGILSGLLSSITVLELPKMLQRKWHAEILEYLKQNYTESRIVEFDINTEKCETKVALPAPSESFTLKSKIKEMLAEPKFITHTLLLIGIVTSVAFASLLRLGSSFAGLMVFAFIATLITLSAIDVKSRLLPDVMTLPLIWIGLLVNLHGTFSSLEDAVIGAISGYVILWILFQAFLALRGIEGMGFGDFKLMAAIGAWLGWQALPYVALIAAISGFGVTVILCLIGRARIGDPFAFGPYLAVGGSIAFYMQTYH
ncbi:prepilin peptidase [Burkholderia metallica]|uniref:prepilin peptidase n=1 Tax=Burkholderia metallica TaxID=488729 RepID=UPI00157B4D2E|nr:A24 family peptidase [Burkholderia metallica]NTZ89075.1 prepilin peptidase [Burkholderia metallica]